MPTKKYSVQLKGKGVLDEYAVRLEGTNVPMYIRTENLRRAWLTTPYMYSCLAKR